ncbi:MAG: hypothetical protein JXQ76_12180 [Campylobacterales bacterium]|nr:hypothetical protein [Campylobacterales bacterium]
MKKLIHYLLITAIALALSACGSNSKEDPSSSSSTTASTNGGGLVTGDTTSSGTTTDTTVVNSQEYTFINATTPLEVTKAGTLYQLKAQLVQYQHPVSGAKVFLKAFKNPFDKYGTFASMSTTTDDKGYFTFEYTSPSDLSAINGNIIKFETVLYYEETNTTYEELTQNFMVTFKTDGSSSNDVIDNNVTDGEGYSFINATTPLEIVEAESEYDIKVQLIANGFAVADETVTLKAFSNPNDQYGTFTALSAKTDALGYATFKYTSPKDMDAVNNKSLNLTAVLIDGNLTQDFQLQFNKSEAVVVSEKPFVVIPNSSKTIELTNNSQQAVIAIKVFAGETNSPYSEGNVEVVLPAKIVDGVDIGSFESYSVPVVNGEATFRYTGPQNLKALIDSGDTSSVFKFYHDADPTNKKEMSVTYNPTSDYVPINYTMEISSEDNKFTMGIPDQEKSFSIVVKDDAGNDVAKDKMTSYEIVIQNTFVGKLISNGVEYTTLTLQNENPITFNVKSNTKSGLIPLRVTATFEDANGVTRTLQQTVNITVYSGPPTAMSISYVGVEHDEARGKYIERYAVSATDAYNNKVNTSPGVATGALVGYAVDGSAPNATETDATKRLYFGKNDTPKGTITPIGGGFATFSVTPDGQNRFQHVDENNDKLVLFGEGYTYEALGKWDFNRLSNEVLELKDTYLGATRSNLFYAIGHNYRQDPCRSDGTEYIGFGQVDSNSSTLDSQGTAIVTFTYDYHLTGKDIMLWVNLTGYQADTDQTTRIGEAKKVTLRGNGLISEPTDGYSVTKGTTVDVDFSIWHENVPEFYRNAHFGWGVEPGSNCAYEVINTSNYYDARSCVAAYGAAFISFRLTAPLDKDCTFNINRILTATEFE